MSNRYLDTALFDKAARFAIKAHANTERRERGSPYTLHVMEAAAITETMTNDPELLAAALLHDTVEDTDVTVEDIRELFGDRVAELVWAESDPEIEGLSEAESWKERKRIVMNRLSKMDRDTKMVALGDKLSNMRAIAREYQVIGDRIWERFHVKDKKEHEWHYRGLAEALSELSDTLAYREFVKLIDITFADISAR